MKKAIILIGPGFEDSEFLYPFYRLQEAGYAVDVACWSDKPAAGKYGVPVTPTINLENLKASDYEVVVVPGGHESPDRVRQIPKALALIRDMNKNGRIVSEKKHKSAKREKRLLKYGYTAKKGKFGAVKIGAKKSRKARK